MKTVRLQQVIAACGRPVIHLLWTKSAKDAQLMKALHQHRVMTLHQTVRGTTKDYGTIGLQMDAHAQILIFPRSLKKFSDRRVIGIDYSNIGEPSATDSTRPGSGKSSRQPSRPRSSAVPMNAERVIPLPARAVRERKPPKPPLTTQEFTRGLARAQSAFRKQNYREAADIVQEIADKMKRTS